jgi:hypothetical protein
MKEQAPIKTHDYRYQYHGHYTEGGVCRIRVYSTEPPTIIASELDENTNTSVTNMAEHLYPEIVRTHFPEQYSDATPVRWIEHYPEPANPGRPVKAPYYTLVTFSSYTPRRITRGGLNRLEIGTPHRKHISPDEVRSLTGDESL